VPILIITIISFLRGLRSVIDTYNYFEIRKLSKFGIPDNIFSEIECQLEDSINSNYILRENNSIYLLKDWIIVESMYNIRFLRASDLLWVYKNRITIKGWGSETESYVIMYRSNSKSLKIEGNEKDIDTILNKSYLQYTWAVKGYDSRLESMWKKNRMKFIEFAENNKLLK